MIRALRSRDLWLGLAPVLALLALWQYAATAGWTDRKFLPPVSVVLAAPGDPLVRRLLLEGLGASLQRYIEGVAIGSTVGLAFGLWLGLAPAAARFVGPSFNAFRQVAIFAWIPLLTAWLGVGEAAKVTFVALAAFKPMVMNAQDGVRNVPAAYLETGRALRLGRWKLLTRILLPAATPSILAGLQLAFISGWLATLGVETLVGFGAGLGAVLIDGRQHFRMDVVLFGIALVAALGFLFNLALRLCFRRLLRWRDGAL